MDKVDSVDSIDEMIGDITGTIAKYAQYLTEEFYDPTIGNLVRMMENSVDNLMSKKIDIGE